MTLSGSISWVISRIAGYFEYRRTLRDLSSLSDQQLMDVGLVRSHIDDVARSALHRHMGRSRA
jgi:uncharacterized protein YjiS (DUF1127 family)